MKTIELWRLPDVLIVHLKRFEYKHTRTKLDTFVDFPLEGLDLESLCRQNRVHQEEQDDNQFVLDTVPANYDLFAVINHYGRMGFGHYTAFARRWNRIKEGAQAGWMLYDDLSVANAKTVMTPAVYVLFYR